MFVVLCVRVYVRGLCVCGVCGMVWQRRVQAISVRSDSFENRLSLPWKGLREEDLSRASGIEGGVFVHISGFIGTVMHPLFKFPALFFAFLMSPTLPFMIGRG